MMPRFMFFSFSFSKNGLVKLQYKTNYDFETLPLTVFILVVLGENNLYSLHWVCIGLTHLQNLNCEKI